MPCVTILGLRPSARRRVPAPPASQPTVAVSEFAFNGPVTSAADATDAAEMRVLSAALLQPFFAWVGADLPRARKAMLTRSDAAATHQMLRASGGLTEVLHLIHERTGVNWEPTSRWDRVQVTATEVATVAQIMSEERSERSFAVTGAMRHTKTDLTFGLREHYAAASAQAASTLSISTGWDLCEDTGTLHTHALCVGWLRSTVVLTSIPLTRVERHQWHLASARTQKAVLPMHQQSAGDLLTTAFTESAARLRTAN